LRERGFLADEKLTAKSILSRRERQDIITIDCEKSVLEAINTIKSLNISQIPVTQQGMIVGKLTESDILNSVLENPGLKSGSVKEIMTASFPFIDLNTSVDKISSIIKAWNLLLMSVIGSSNTLDICSEGS
jgi:cystathionine beta-synthase